MKHFLYKLLSKQNITKFVIIFSVGLFSRYLVNSYYDINVFTNFKDYISILYYSCMAIFTVFVHQYVEHFNISFIPQPMIDVFDRAISLNKLQDGPTIRSPSRNHTSNSTSTSDNNSDETAQVRRSRNRRISNNNTQNVSANNTESNTKHSSTDKQTGNSNTQSKPRSNILKVRDNTVPPSSYYRINTIDAYRHQLKYSNRIVVASPIMNSNTTIANGDVKLLQHFNHNTDSFANRMLRQHSITINDTSNSTDISTNITDNGDSMMVPLVMDTNYPQKNDIIHTSNSHKDSVVLSPNPLNFTMSMDSAGNIILQKDNLRPLNTTNSDVSNKSEASSGVRKLLGERRTRVFEGIQKPGFEALAGYSDKEVVIPKKGLGNRLLLGFRNKITDAASKIDSIYIKYYDGGRRKFLWTIWERNKDNYLSYKDFKANWDPKSSVWKKISNEIKHDISEEVRNLIKINNPFENKRIHRESGGLLKGFIRNKEK